MQPKKSLGQHWLFDQEILGEICAAADVKSGDDVLEIGAGLGTLTAELLRRGARVWAVELDPALARALPDNVGKILSENLDYTSRKVASDDAYSSSKNFSDRKTRTAVPAVLKNLTVLNQDFLKLDLSRLPAGYKIVGNIPYYITSPIVKKILSVKNRPAVIVLLVQKEVAARLAAPAGDSARGASSVLAQILADVRLGVKVSADKFTPPPKVDSQVVILRPRRNFLPDDFFKIVARVVKAGFSARRKKLKSSLAGGLGIDKAAALQILQKSDIDPDARAQDLTNAQWLNLAKIYAQFSGANPAQNFKKSGQVELVNRESK
ncbi:MAG: 16S rRNA (adenine(1518)-N(6)/adenine(1519)-N(6))-dimethyltransferase [Candidatus Nomurabacteria bacterium]|jgi:16S rRNA (adenine1518-N6/adenine1519-N6)-dimethyltransferase|nr:16S rRNA (adenine(1518)-N(6)/adenine(1519)-N(6))-dimethyltransferase [Candidatus Nomurabacteria bacterium]